MLTISGNSEFLTAQDATTFRRQERTYRNFSGHFTRPDNADPDNVNASNKHGVLEIIIQKQTKPGPRKTALEG
jgi:HSP20 family protein